MGLLLLIPNYSTERQTMIIQQFSAALGLILINKISFYSFTTFTIDLQAHETVLDYFKHNIPNYNTKTPFKWPHIHRYIGVF